MIAVYGTGDMAAVYFDVLRALEVASDEVVIVGRSEPSARKLAAAHGACSALLGEEAVLRPDRAIIAVTPDALPTITRHALSVGIRDLLVEKPGALSSVALRALHADVVAAQARAHMVLNRRYLPSVERCRELIEEDGGSVACYFEMTEVEERVLGLKAKGTWPEENWPRWGLINPLHVLDLATWLCGRPAELSPRRQGRLAWHETGATFFGTGRSENGAALVYLATWGTAGRWRIEVTTARRRLFLCPIESLEQQWKNSFATSKVELPSEPAGLKPGFANLLRDFLSPGGPKRLPNLLEAAATLECAERIFGYA